MEKLEANLSVGSIYVVYTKNIVLTWQVVFSRRFLTPAFDENILSIKFRPIPLSMVKGKSVFETLKPIIFYELIVRNFICFIIKNRCIDKLNNLCFFCACKKNRNPYLKVSKIYWLSYLSTPVCKPFFDLRHFYQGFMIMDRNITDTIDVHIDVW